MGWVRSRRVNVTSPGNVPPCMRRLLVLLAVLLVLGAAPAPAAPGDPDPAWERGSRLAGREVLADGRSYGIDDRGRVFRATAAGEPDPSFGGDGYVEVPGLQVSAGSFLVADGDRVLVAGLAGPEATLARLRADGSLDASWGGDGTVASASSMASRSTPRAASTSCAATAWSGGCRSARSIPATGRPASSTPAGGWHGSTCAPTGGRSSPTSVATAPSR